MKILDLRSEAEKEIDEGLDDKIDQGVYRDVQSFFKYQTPHEWHPWQTKSTLMIYDPSLWVRSK